MLNNTSSKSIEILKAMGYDVEGSPQIDFFVENLGDIIVSNPPYSIKKKIFARLALLDKPFILSITYFNYYKTIYKSSQER